MAAWLAVWLAVPAVDGEDVGPVSREHPAEAQPVAAGPVKVGAPSPRLDEVTGLVWALIVVAGVAFAPAWVTNRAATSERTDSNGSRTNFRRTVSPRSAVPGVPRSEVPPGMYAPILLLLVDYVEM